MRLGIALILAAMFGPLVVAPARGATVEYSLTISRQAVTLDGVTADAMTVNGGIPGPVLTFNEGDHARIHVRNEMSVPTSIHWHGILLPPGMDGVPNISFPAIAPGTTFTYEFDIRQKGTYWYHSHSALQEQRGVYGAIVIHPRQQQHRYESVVLFSDWTHEDPHAVLRTLKRGSEWYAVAKGKGQSLFGAARVGRLGDFFTRELQRMPPMDIADVAYDRFLANGQPATLIPEAAGHRYRLRLVNGSATSFFYVESATGTMTIVAADGQDVQPVSVARLLIGVAETYDVLVDVPQLGAYELRATAHDGSAYASVWLGRGEHHAAAAVADPDVYRAMGGLSFAKIFAWTPSGSMGMPDRAVLRGAFDAPGMAGMAGMGEMDTMPAMGMSQNRTGMDADATMSANEMKKGPMEMPAMAMLSATKDHAQPASAAGRIGNRFAGNYYPMAADVSSAATLAVDGISAQRPAPPYKKLQAPQSTAFAIDRPHRDIRLTLDGDMQRYVWLLNNRPLSAGDDIRIRQGEVVRFMMVNRTMMYHPMHLHGHFFRVINGQGDRSPLKHTVIVEPMSTTVIEFDANEVGDWFFHCHLLYHMESGMARMVHYENFALPENLQGLRQRLYHDPWYAWADVDVLSQMTEGNLTLTNTFNTLTADWEVGWGKVGETEWEGEVLYRRYINRFLSLLAGANLSGYNDTLDKTRGVAGAEYLLPMNLTTRLWLDSDGGGRVLFDKELELTPRLSAFGEAEYDSREKWSGQTGLSYLVTKALSAKVQWHSDHGWGGGVQMRF
ncbi:multicopper oxidase domain-containing protein [Desulfuromonas acetoxidans]|uniref:Multicopper oxidase, type 3 n=1 Tax=Desulfuromonas acetoxidans (strain DSM 684 / 11070) TaxID=281689 RepID=Q1JY60_DESA6|nr:multicopper oxidase domain-containing protein [Desulfuromonas acetoxidans]EAT15136.1 multicopper oxidase, type 3 [Desulfuromonas acetoxidans DSM 684]MBF0643963.1 multicopper oxidase domain-containing protein [Desulfuromonas acetoxidans]NVD23201.1 multicopper oxidase domain-containing protein [Desulfuromonas acetoxidans]NVE15558.1 multicopper oxidase domain-containing protein [Desulfuromonas acetoxidans]